MLGKKITAHTLMQLIINVVWKLFLLNSCQIVNAQVLSLLLQGLICISISRLPFRTERFWKIPIPYFIDLNKQQVLLMVLVLLFVLYFFDTHFLVQYIYLLFVYYIVFNASWFERW